MPKLQKRTLRPPAPTRHHSLSLAQLLERSPADPYTLQRVLHEETRAKRITRTATGSYQLAPAAFPGDLVQALAALHP